ncbi:hypothetical protein H4Q26_009205 [Puccinia striiformis f. sp. tritici PST-130]|nr:hypothetical protein H4Q26_009205 [Puccinia striiformis f. sp. tritici PST-130]
MTAATGWTLTRWNRTHARRIGNKEGFGGLARKCFAQRNTNLCTGLAGETLAIDPLKFENALLTQLGSSIFRQQLTTLYIHFNLQFTISTPEKLESVPEATNNQHQIGARIYRLYGLDECLNERLFDKVHCLFGTESALQMAGSLIPVIKLSRLFFSKASDSGNQPRATTAVHKDQFEPIGSSS